VPVNPLSMFARFALFFLVLRLAGLAKDPVNAKSVTLKKAPPTSDLAPAQFDYQETRGEPGGGDDVALELKKEDRIALVGNRLLDRAQEFGNVEALMHLAHPEFELVIPVFAWSADEPDVQPRPD
jgi:hypothetical protein